MEGIVRLEKLSEPVSGFVGLVPAVGGELYSVVWNGLVDIAVLCCELLE